MSNRWESLKAMRSAASNVYEQYGLLFCTLASGDELQAMQTAIVARLAAQRDEMQDLYNDNVHLLQTGRYSIRTPMSAITVRTLTEGACVLCCECDDLGDILLQAVADEADPKQNLLYHQIMSTAVADEINAALLRIECPGEQVPTVRDSFIREMFVRRSELTNKGKKKGLLNISTGRLSQLKGFPKPVGKDGKDELFLIADVNAWCASTGRPQI